MANSTLRRSVSGSSAVLLVISAVVGSGVFKKIAPMSESLHDGGLVLLCWLIAGLLSLVGALCTAELAAMMPGSGGEFVYFKRIYGRFFSFLYGWANLVVMKSATIAALAFIFSQSLYALLPPAWVAGLGASAFAVKIFATLLIVLLSYVNFRGVVLSAVISKVLITGIVGAMLIFIGYAFTGHTPTVADVVPERSAPLDGFGWTTAFFAAALSAFWGYEGWNNVGYIGEEVKKPQRNIPLALIVGTMVVMLFYLGMNAAYLRILPVEAYAAMAAEQEKIAAVEAANVLFGSGGAILLSLLILCSTFNCTNSTILMSARIFYAMSRDKLFLPFASKVHPKHQTPSNAILLQGTWAILLIWWGSFDQLTDLLVFAAFIFYGATALGVILMRRREPTMERPYRVLAYPVLPMLFFVFCVTLVVITIIGQPMQALIGLGLIAAGVPVYLYYRRQTAKETIT